MTKRSRFIVLTLITLLASTSAFGLQYGRTESFYSDATHATPVGAYFDPGMYCLEEDEPYSWGTTSNYKRDTRWATCGEVIINAQRCWEWVNEDWVEVDCPPCC